MAVVRRIDASLFTDEGREPEYRMLIHHVKFFVRSSNFNWNVKMPNLWAFLQRLEAATGGTLLPHGGPPMIIPLDPVADAAAVALEDEFEEENLDNEEDDPGSSSSSAPLSNPASSTTDSSAETDSGTADQSRHEHITLAQAQRVEFSNRIQTVMDNRIRLIEDDQDRVDKLLLLFIRLGIETPILSSWSFSID